MFYCTVLLLLAATADVFGYSLVEKSTQVGVVGGGPVSIYEVPYMAELRREDEYHWCAATIVHQQFVLTAAHCIEKNVKYLVSVGSDDTRRGIIHEVDKAFPHEEYASKYDYDIALVKLTKEIDFGLKVKHIELAAEPFDLLPGMTFNLTGWGRSSSESDESTVLRQVSLPFLAQSECQKIYRGDVDLTDNVLCAGEIDDGNGPCYADGGSPLVYDNILVGITARGKGCGMYPAIYTKIAAFEDWIKETVSKNT